jgi:hypothetical protein
VTYLICAHSHRRSPPQCNVNIVALGSSEFQQILSTLSVIVKFELVVELRGLEEEMGVSSPWPRSIVLGLGPISTRNTINPVRQNCFSLRWYPESLFQRMLPTHVPLRWLTSLQCSLPMTLFTSGIDQPESGTER